VTVDRAYLSDACPLVTADRRLYNALHTAPDFDLLWIGCDLIRAAHCGGQPVRPNGPVTCTGASWEVDLAPQFQGFRFPHPGFQSWVWE
jgi:hypothetical protein